MIEDKVLQKSNEAHEPITEADLKDLKSFEQLISKGLQTFYDVGHALAEIRDRKLYRQSYGTFEDYCQQRWGFSRQRAAQLISGTEVAENLSTIVDKKELLESHTRELASVPAHEQRLVYQLANELTEGNVTASAIRSLAAVANGVIASGYVEVNDGIQKPWLELQPEEKRAVLQANLEKETFERMMQNKQRGSLSKTMADPIIEKVSIKKEQLKDLIELAKYADIDSIEAYEKKWGHKL